MVRSRCVVIIGMDDKDDANSDLKDSNPLQYGIVLAALEINGLIDIFKGYLIRKRLPIILPIVILEVYGDTDMTFFSSTKVSFQYDGDAKCVRRCPLPRLTLHRDVEEHDDDNSYFKEVNCSNLNR